MCERTKQMALKFWRKAIWGWMEREKIDVGFVPDKEKLISLLLPSPWFTSGLTTGFKT